MPSIWLYNCVSFMGHQAKLPTRFGEDPNSYILRAMESFMQLVAESLHNVEELMPWDLEETLQTRSGVVLLDIREHYEFEAMHIAAPASAAYWPLT